MRNLCFVTAAPGDSRHIDCAKWTRPGRALAEGILYMNAFCISSVSMT